MDTVEDLCRELNATCEKRDMTNNPLIASDERLYAIALSTDAYLIKFKSDMVEVDSYSLYRIKVGDRTLITSVDSVVLFDSNDNPIVVLKAGVGGIIHWSNGDTELHLYVDKL